MKIKRFFLLTVIVMAIVINCNLVFSATALQGFDKTYYLNSKLAQLKGIDPATWNSYTTANLEALLANYGFTAESHYNAYGWIEGLSPNASFDQGQYLYGKGVQMYQAGGYGSIPKAIAAFKAAWPYDPYRHYLLYGAAEGLNPLNNFDENAYLTDKLADLAMADPSGWGSSNIAYLRTALASAGMTPLSHYLAFGELEGNCGPYPLASGNYTYSVYGGSAYISGVQGYSPSQYGYTFLGTGSSTKTFNGSYSYYIITTNPPNTAYVDTVKGSNNLYYPTWTTGNSTGWDKVGGSPDGISCVVGGLYNGQADGYILINPEVSPLLSSITVYTSNSQASSCFLSISPSLGSFTSSGGTSIISVTATTSSCAWTASENLSWVSLSSTSGSGNGAISVTVSANTGAARTGSVTIAGKTYTISQAAPVAGCTNIAGNWSGSETGNYTCNLDGESEGDTYSLSGNITIFQDGCNIWYELDASAYDLGIITRTGTINGSILNLTGPFVGLTGEHGCTVNTNIVTITGVVNGNTITLEGFGNANGTCDGISGSCVMSATAIIHR